MKILSIKNFYTKLPKRVPGNRYIGVHLKGTKKFGSNKVVDRQLFRRKTETVFGMKILSAINFTVILLRIIDYQDHNRRITKKFTKKFDSKVINRQNFHRKTGLQQ